MNIVLIGMPGCGKSSVSEILAKKLGYKLVDTDVEIVKNHGNISEIFKNFGEEYFRDLETQAVIAACAQTNAVIATGGGCLLREENARALKSSGKIVYLKASAGELARRLAGDGTRPLLQGDAKAKIDELFKVRAHIYAGYADFTVDTDGISAEEAAKKIVEFSEGKI